MKVIPVKATATALSSTHTKGSVSSSGHISGGQWPLSWRGQIIEGTQTFHLPSP